MFRFSQTGVRWQSLSVVGILNIISILIFVAGIPGVVFGRRNIFAAAFEFDRWSSSTVGISLTVRVIQMHVMIVVFGFVGTGVSAGIAADGLLGSRLVFHDNNPLQTQVFGLVAELNGAEGFKRAHRNFKIGNRFRKM